MKRIGVMGCGMVATYGHLPVIASLPELELAAVFDPDEARAQETAAKFGAAGAYSDPEEFFSAGLDAVTITSPAPAHKQNVLDAARHGLHVLCEKPLAMEPADARIMIDAMDMAGCLLSTGFDYRFSPVATEIKQLIGRGAIGEVRAARLVYIWNLHGKRLPDGSENPRRAGRMLEGGPMVDCGVHQIDLARWWLGTNIHNWDVQAAWVDEYEAPDHMWLRLNLGGNPHANHVHTVVEMCYSYAHTAAQTHSQFVYELIGTDGIIRFDRNASVFELRDTNGTHPFPTAGEKNFLGMYQAFALALETGQLGDLPSGEDGLIATEIAREATQRAIATREQPPLA